MTKLQKVVWYEGMKLDPHHFQQMDRYIQYNLNKRIGSISFNNWGFTVIHIDTNLLVNGNFNLVECSGVMPDGLYFNIPENNSLPRSRQFENIFDAIDDKLEVYLAIPLEQATGNNCQLEDFSEHKLTRYSLKNIDLLDDNVGSNLRQVGIASPNFYIKFGNENLEDFSKLKIGEIVRSSDGTYLMDKDFIPTILNLSSSDSIMHCIREILGGLVAKSNELYSQLNPNKQEITKVDVEILLLLQAINMYIPIINQYYNTPHYHPEIVYSMFLSLGGQLSTIMTDSGIASTDFEPYNHKNLNEIFHKIYKQLLTLLNIQKRVSKPDILIPLDQKSDSLFVANLSQEQIDSQLFIVVKSSKSENTIITEFSNNIKIAAYEEIFAVNQAGLQGVNIEYVARPPSGLSMDTENHYFRILQEGRFWNKIVEKQTLAFFIAKDYTQIDLQLISFIP